ncbi:MAG: type III secretion system translocon subunit SctE [Rhodospirillaceae bacterium]|nr:type III secretion system translocon subunit SctE [Rhodospirillaceae bacterium]
MDADIMMTLLYAIQQKQGQDQIKTSEARIDDKKLQRQKKHDEIMNKIKQMHKAEKKGGTGAKIGMAFGWIGVGLAWIAVGVVGVVSGGAAAVPLAVAATAMTALMICQQTGATEKAIDAMNLDSKGAMGVQIGMAAAMLVINIGAMIMSGGAAAGGVVAGGADVAEAGAQAGVAASEVATTTAEAGTQAGVAASEAATAGLETGTEGAGAGSETAAASVEAGTDTAETTASVTEETSSTADTASQAAGKSGRLVRAANRVRSAAQIAQATTQAGGGAAEITTAKYNYEAAEDRADAQDERAELVKAQEITLEELRRIRKLIEEMQNASTIVIGTIDETQETAMNIRRTI